jgi:phosphoribosyl 1,2-cyclic phosphodiesterase
MESNHDIEMLNNSSYPFKIRKRILGDKGHLSNYDSAKYLSQFIGTKTKCIILAHLSEENNTKDLAYQTLKTRLNNQNQNIDKIVIATQNKETELIEV